MPKKCVSIAPNDCYGCSACAGVCPFDAIKTVPNEKGFTSVKIDFDLCRDCGLCASVCPVQSKENFLSDGKPAVWAVKHKDESIRAQSTSGGAFSAFVSALKDDSAVVYGAAVLNNTVTHVRVENGDIAALRGSKYAQSALNDCFLQVKRDLQAGRTVLFSGTPCQCGGLRSFLSLTRVSEQNLYTVDFICHGTMSPLLFEEYIRYCEQKSNKKIVDHKFRSKKKGWHNHLEENRFEDGKTDSESFESQIAKSIFYLGSAYSERCYTCQYACKERVSDITMADFWGIERAMPEYDDNKGVSMLLLNTKKGRDLFLVAKDLLDCREASLTHAKQPHLQAPVKRPEITDEFWATYKKKGFRKLCVKYCSAGRLRRLAAKIYHRIFK